MNKSKIIIFILVIISVYYYSKSNDSDLLERNALYSMMLVANAENIVDQSIIFSMPDNGMTMTVNDILTEDGESIAYGKIEYPKNKICKNLSWKFSGYGESYQLINASNCY